MCTKNKRIFVLLGMFGLCFLQNSNAMKKPRANYNCMERFEGKMFPTPEAHTSVALRVAAGHKIPLGSVTWETDAGCVVVQNYGYVEIPCVFYEIMDIHDRVEPTALDIDVINGCYQIRDGLSEFAPAPSADDEPAKDVGPARQITNAPTDTRNASARKQHRPPSRRAKLICRRAFMCGWRSDRAAFCYVGNVFGSLPLYYRNGWAYQLDENGLVVRSKWRGVFRPLRKDLRMPFEVSAFLEEACNAMELNDHCKGCFGF